MAGSMKTTGTEELAEALGKLGQEAPNIASKSLYDGAAVVADAYSRAVAGIRTEPFYHAGGGNKRLASPAEKAALKRVTGIAKFSKNGSEVDTIVGACEGYVTVAGERKAVKLIARSINAGTSFMERQSVFRKAQSSSKNPAQQKMIATANELMEKIIH